MSQVQPEGTIEAKSQDTNLASVMVDSKKKNGEPLLDQKDHFFL